LDLKIFFALDLDLYRKSWEFHPNEGVNSTCYSVSFKEARTAEDAWKTLNLALQKSPNFYFKQIDFINIPKDLPI
jgi:hypothetical protein